MCHRSGLPTEERGGGGGGTKSYDGVKDWSSINHSILSCGEGELEPTKTTFYLLDSRIHLLMFYWTSGIGILSSWFTFLPIFSFAMSLHVIKYPKTGKMPVCLLFDACVRPELWKLVRSSFLLSEYHYNLISNSSAQERALPVLFLYLIGFSLGNLPKIHGIPIKEAFKNWSLSLPRTVKHVWVSSFGYISRRIYVNCPECFQWGANRVYNFQINIYYPPRSQLSPSKTKLPADMSAEQPRSSSVPLYSKSTLEFSTSISNNTCLNPPPASPTSLKFLSAIS